ASPQPPGDRPGEQAVTVRGRLVSCRADIVGPSGEYRACSAQRAGHCGIGRCTPAASQNTFPERRVADCYQHNSAQNAVPGCGARRMRGKAISTTVRVDSKGDIGLQDVFGLASDATIIGGTQIVEVGGTAISTTVYVDSAIFQFGLLD